MALDPRSAVTTGPTDDGTAPKMLHRPADAPPALAHVRGSDAVRTLHLDWAALHGPGADLAPSGPWPRLKGKARRALGVGRGDRELLGAVIRALDAVAVRCDELADRLSAQESLMEDVSTSYGEDITRLRADVMALRATIDDG
jgi:hypothetical protein